MTTSARSPVAVRLDDGRVLIAGLGENGDAADLYDPVTRVFTSVADSGLPGWTRTAVPLADGRVLLMGEGVALFDPSSGTITPTVSGPGLEPGPAARLPDGRILVLDATYPRAVLFDPATDAFVPTSTPGFDGYTPTATALRDGRVLVTAGSAVLYDPGTATFTPTGPMIPIGPGHTAMLLADGRVLVSDVPRPGRSDGQGPAMAELYDPATGTFSSTGAMGAERAAYSATLLPDGRILVAGGSTPKIGEDPWVPLATAELYDPATGTSTPTGAMATARIRPAGVLLSDGLVLVAGGWTRGQGYDEVVPLASAELYDPATGTFTPNQSLTSAPPSP